MENLLIEIKKEAKKAKRTIKIMNVCGTHEETINKAGIRQLLPENVKLFPGPGCPVCVTPEEEIIEVIEFSKKEDCIVATYGDMYKIPTKKGSLEDVKASGGNVEIVYSPMESLKLAMKRKDKLIVFFSIGFETTTAPVSVILKKAENEGLENFKIYSSNKLTPPAVETLMKKYGNYIDGLITPGHVSAIIGVKGWRKITNEFGIPQVISGFESRDVLLSILMILKMINRGEAEIINEYERVVEENGNSVAMESINHVFQKTHSFWRGIGKIEKSGYIPKKRFKDFVVDKKSKNENIENKIFTACKCEKILCGLATPKDCPLFGKICNPQTPKGPCMVSREGACYLYYTFGA